MDLNTVKRNLNNGNYGEVEGCLADIQLIWDNCKLYNSKETVKDCIIFSGFGRSPISWRRTLKKW